MTVEEFKDIILTHHSAMRRLAESMLNDNDLAADAVQEAVINLWNKKEDLERAEKKEALCITVVKCRCVDILRQQRPSEPIDEKVLMMEEQSGDENLEERYRMARRVIDLLPEKQRKAILMKYEDDLPNREIEKVLNVSSTNLYAIFSRAYKSIRETMEKLNDYERGK